MGYLAIITTVLRQNGKLKGSVIAYLLFSQLMLAGNNGQTAINVTKLSSDEGLKQSMVHQIIQDYRGLIWMVTGDGLHCYNGSEFNVFRVPLNPPFSVADNTMRGIVELEPGIIAISTAASLCIFNSVTASFSSMVQQKGLHPRLFNVVLHNQALAWVYGKGLVWVSDSGILPMVTNGVDAQFYKTMPQPFDAVKLNDSVVVLLCDSMLIELKIGGFNPQKTIVNQSYKLNEKGLKLAVDTANNLWILNSNNIISYHGHGKFGLPKSTPFQGATSFYIDYANRFWLASANQVYLSNPNQNIWMPLDFCINQGRFTDTLKPYIISFFEDAEQNIWIGTDGDGALIYNARQLIFKRANTGFSRFIESHGNKILAGTFKNGLWIMDADLSNPELFLNPHFRSGTDFLATYRTQNQLWIAHSNGITIFNTQHQVVQEWKMPLSRAAFYEINPGLLYLSTPNNLIVIKNEAQAKIIGQVRASFIADMLVYNGFVWTATPYGLQKLKPEQLLITESYGSDFQVSASTIKSLLLLGNIIWAATGSGIELFDNQGISKPLPSELEILKTEVIYGLLADSIGRVWFSCNSGIGCFDTISFSPVFFGEHHNIQATEFNSSAFYKSKAGLFYFGGIRGINAFNPFDYKPKPAVGKPALVELFVSDTQFFKGLPPRQLSVQMHWKNANINGKVFSTVYNDIPDQKYSFYLEGADRTWSVAQKSATFNYRNMRTGKYELWVKASDGNNYWCEPVKLLNITIKPPIWQQWWFQITSFLLLVGAIILTVKQRQKKKYLATIKELEHQNALERERLRISRDLHDELGAGLSLILLNSSLAQDHLNQPGAVESVLKRINKNTKELYESMSNLVWLLKPENQTLAAMLAKMRELVADICDDAGIEVEFDFPDTQIQLAMQREASRHIYLIIKEAVNNAIKYACAYKISIAFQHSKQSLNITVTDDGVGFDAKCITKQGNGLLNMKSRTENMNGTIKVESEPGKGTVLTLMLPGETVFENG